MNFDEFAARYRKPEDKATRAYDPGIVAESTEVVLAGTVQSIEPEWCCIDINGMQYDIPRADIGDVQLLSTLAKRDETSDDKDDKSEPADDAEIGASDVVMFTMKSTAVLCQRTSVQAGLVASIGTWISLVPGPTEAAREEPAPASASA